MTSILCMMANLKQQQPPPSSQQQAKDTERIYASQQFYSGDYNTIRHAGRQGQGDNGQGQS